MQMNSILLAAVSFYITLSFLISKIHVYSFNNYLKTYSTLVKQLKHEKNWFSDRFSFFGCQSGSIENADVYEENRRGCFIIFIR